MSSLLNVHPLFSTLSYSQFEGIKARLRLRTLADKESLFQQGDAFDAFYFVERGTIQLFRLSEGGDSKVIEWIKTGETFAEALMFSGIKKYPLYAQAVGKTSVTAIPAAPYLELLRASPDTTFALLADMSRRLHHRLVEIDRISLSSAQERLLSWLAQEAESLRGTPSSTAEGVFIPLKMAKRLLAARLSMQPETLSRLFNTLEKEGILAKELGGLRVFGELSP